MFSVISWWYVLCMEYVFISYYVIELEGFINKLLVVLFLFIKFLIFIFLLGGIINI